MNNTEPIGTNTSVCSADDNRFTTGRRLVGLRPGFRFYIDHVVRLREPMSDLLNSASVQEQREIYDNKIRDALWRPSLAFCLHRDPLLSLTGIPPEQRRQIQRFQPDILAYLRGRAENVIYNTELVKELFMEERVHAYGSILIATLAGDLPVRRRGSRQSSR